ncbi:hypothetical protein GGI23_006930, partial [Coemansia sp. RSA 2559]
MANAKENAATNISSAPARAKQKLSNDKIEDLPKSPVSGSRRKVQLRKAPAEIVQSDSSDSDSDKETPPRRLAKIPVLGTPDRTTQSVSNSVLGLAKPQRSRLGQHSGPGIASISQMASSKPYEDLRKSMAKHAAAKAISSLKNEPNKSKAPAHTDTADESSESDADSDSDSDSESGSDSDMSDFLKDGGNNKGSETDMSGARAAAAGGRKMPIR